MHQEQGFKFCLDTRNNRPLKALEEYCDGSRRRRRRRRQTGSNDALIIRVLSVACGRSSKNV
jgi:hypothetical protein